MFKMFKNKKGSEVIQNLIVIAIMGALAITAISAIATQIKEKNTEVVQNIGNNLDSAYQE